MGKYVIEGTIKIPFVVEVEASSYDVANEKADFLDVETIIDNLQYEDVEFGSHYVDTVEELYDYE